MVREDGSPIRHEWYSDEFQRLRQQTSLRPSTSRAFAIPASASCWPAACLHVVAAWHGHDPAVSLSIYSEAQRDDLCAAGAALFA